MERETMRSITDWWLLASVHHDPVPSQVTAAGSCAQVTRPGMMPRGTPNGESVGSNKEERMLVAAAIERANCRRVISIRGSLGNKSRASSAVEDGFSMFALTGGRKRGTPMTERPRGDT